VAGALTPALAASVGLACAAFAGRATRAPNARPRRRFLLVGVFAGAFLGFLVAGYVSTLVFGAMFLAALAVVAEGFGRREMAPVVAAGLLLGAAALAHPVFLLLGGVIALGGALALVGSWRVDELAGRPAWERSLARMVAAGLVAVPVLGAGMLLAADPAGHAPVDTSRDAVLRRTGLPSLLRASYLRKLHHDFPWWRTIGVVGLALSPLASRTPPAAPPEPADRDRARLFGGAMAAWLLVTAGVVLALILGASAPGQRLADFCLPLPILAGLGLSAVRPRSRRLGAALVAGGTVLFLAVAWAGWAASRPLVTPAQLAQLRIVGSALGRLPAGTPVVLVMDDHGDKPALRVTRFANYLRDAVPAGRVPDVALFVGSPADLLAGHPTRTGQAEHDALATTAWLALRQDLRRPALAVVVHAIDPAGFDDAALLPEARLLGPGVIALPGLDPEPALGPTGPARLTEPGAGPLSPWMPVWLAPVLFVVVAVTGWPWARLGLTDPTPAAVRFALAPAFGGAALSLCAVATDAAGLQLAGAGGWVAAAVALSGWALLAARAAFRASGSGRTPDSSRSAGADRPAGATA
jgi:hypothetical protein